MKPGSCEGQPVLDVVSAFQSYGKFLEEGSTPEAEKRRYDTVRNSCRKDGGACGGKRWSDSALCCCAHIILVEQECTRPSERCQCLSSLDVLTLHHSTMASAAEAMGMALPGSSSNPAATKEKYDECDSVGAYMYNMLKHDIKPRDIMTRAAFENAMVGLH